VFDVYDRQQQRFFSSECRNQLASDLGLSCAPALFEGKTSLNELKEMLATSQSRYRTGAHEGLIIRRQNEDWCEQRAKLVRADFTQSINEHWSSKTIEWSTLEAGKSST
jgi:ATP-dependent RNA circularization protein (DNA/RNA ligase family)